MSAGLRLTATGFASIAVCYGLARFALGLFLPDIRADLGLSSSMAGLISGGSFLGYCLAIVASSSLTERFGARPVVVLAGAIATLGMAAVALSPGPVSLAASVLFAGLSTGLVSPPMAEAVSVAIAPERRDAANTIINAGTSAGLALSGPVAIALGADWRLAYAGFALIALLVTVAALFNIPVRREPNGARTPQVFRLPRLSRDMRRLIAAALLTGAASTAVWSFGGDLTSRHLGWSPAQIGLLWIVTGIAGLAGAAAGTLTGRFGIARVHLAFVAAMAVAVLCVDHPATVDAVALFGGALFGASYVTLTGIYLVWGIAALPERPATGLAIAFLTLAVGQTAGAPVFGFLADAVSPLVAVLVFFALGLASGLVGWSRPKRVAAVC